MRSGASIIAESIERAVDYKIARSSRPRTKTVTGIYVGKDGEGKAWVRLSGAEGAIPVRRMSVQADAGDTVSVTVGGGRAVIDSNVSNPSASSTNVAAVSRRAAVAQETASKAVDYAIEASAASASAKASADGAQTSAEKAHVAAENAQADAVRAHDAADDAMAEAVIAHDAADSAQGSADAAQESADRATFALSDVENVLGTLNWIAEHGEYVLTSDQAVIENKAYYTRSGTGTAQDPYAYTVVVDPQSSALSTYYELSIDESVQNYIASHLWMDNYGLNLSVDSANGYRIHQGTVDGTKPAGTYVISPSGYVVASFGASGFQIGKSGDARLVGDYRSLRLLDKEGDVFFHVSDLRGSDGSYTETFECDGTTTQYTLKVKPVTVVSVKVDGSDVPYTLPTASQTITLGSAPADGSLLEVVYEPYTTSELKAFTYGSRAADSEIGFLSYAEGTEVISSGNSSHAEGYKNESASTGSHAEGQHSKAYSPGSHSEGVQTTAGSLDHIYYGPHAEGYHTLAIRDGSHAEGCETEARFRGCHAEGGNTLATGYYSHAEGKNTSATSDYSHSQNKGTIANMYSQTALGQYNVADTEPSSSIRTGFSTLNGNYAVIIGNGTADDARSNALTVDWNGDVEASGSMSLGTPLAVSSGGTGANTAAGALSNLGLNTSSIDLPLNSDVKAYSASSPPQIHKAGKVVHVVGAVKPSSQIAAGGSFTIATLPTGYRPITEIQAICQGSNYAVWLCNINPNGTMGGQRYRTGDTSTAITTSSWLPFSITFVVA